MSDDNYRNFTLYGEGPFKVLGIEGSACFPLVLPQEHLKKSTEQALSFWAEEYVPIAAEELAWWKSGSILVATDGSAIRNFLSAWTGSGSVVAALPNAWLAVLQVLRSEKIESAKFLVGYSSHYEILIVVNNELVQWQWMRWDEPKSNAENTSATHSDAVNSLPVFILDETMESLLVEGELGAVGKRIAESVGELARASAERIAEGKCNGKLLVHAPSVPQLRPDAPTRTWQTLLLLLGIIVVFSLGGAFQYRTWGYRQIAQEEASESVKTYQTLFPGSRVPTGLLVRMESEFKKLKAVKLGDGEDQPDNKSCLPASVALWRALDSVDGYEIERLQLQGNNLVSLSGYCSSFEEMDNLRQSLLLEGFQVPLLSSSTSNRGAVLEIPVSPWKHPLGTQEKVP